MSASAFKFKVSDWDWDVTLHVSLIIGKTLDGHHMEVIDLRYILLNDA